MKKIKYTPDAADKLRALKMAISQEYGSDSAKKIVKSITDFTFVNPAERLDYKYYILRRLLFEKKQHFGDCGIAGRL